MLNEFPRKEKIRMEHGHGTTNDGEIEQKRRATQPQHDGAKEEKNRKRAIGGGKTDELGVTQGQNGEQGNTTKPRNAVKGGPSRH